MKDLPGDEGASGFYQTVEFLFLSMLDFSSLGWFLCFSVSLLDVSLD